MTVIGLTGFAGAGKSTAAEYLVDRHGFTRLAFAAPLKRMLRTFDPILGFELDDSGDVFEVTLSYLFRVLGQTETEVKQGPYGAKYREHMQILGTECVRAEDPDFWTNAAIRSMSDPEGKYVFDDVRFPNEAKVVSDRNPVGLWNIEGQEYEFTNGLHASEQMAGKLGEQVWLINRGTKEELYKQIDLYLDINAGIMTKDQARKAILGS